MILPSIHAIHINQANCILGSYLDPEYVFHIIDRGSWRFSMGEGQYLVDERNLLLLPPRLLHKVEPVNQEVSDHWVIHFHLPAGDPSLRGLPLVVQAEPKTIGRARQLFLELQSLTQSQSSCKWEAAGVLLQLLSLYRKSTACDSSESQESMQPWTTVTKAIQVIQEQGHHPELMVSDISESCGLSQNHLCRRFREATGMTPYKYLTQFRSERAKELLLNSDLHCGEIARRVGFANEQVFAKAFRRTVGLPPKTWKRHHI